MKQLKKIILLLTLFIVCLFYSINYTYADESLNCEKRLSYNSIGESVKLLQQKLNEITNCNLAIDGVFGSKTKWCVNQFQKKYKLEVDGIVGKKTCTKLNSTNRTTNKYVVINVSEIGYLNIRQKASTSSKIIGNLKMGRIFKVHNKKNVDGTTWYKIKYKGKYGYISGEYVEENAIVLDISSQKLRLYENGEQILNVPVVTGNKGNHDTPIGRYKMAVANKKLATTLKGTNDDGTKYAAYVDYWMPFINSRGIGFHDATWRTSSEITNVKTYLTNGSHACVNMIPEDAKFLYESITKDIYVYVVK